MSRLQAMAPPALLTIAVGLIFGLTVTSDSVSVDAHAAAVQSWRIASTGSPWLDDIAESEEVAKDWFISEAPNGHVVAQRMAGPILLGIPAYASLHRDPDPTTFSLLPGGLAAACITALTTLLLYLAARSHCSQRLSLAGAGAFALATPTWSVSADALWTHSVTQFGLMGAAFAASRDRWWLAGTFLAVGMFGRPHLALVAAVVGLGMGMVRKSARPAIAVAGPTLLSLGLLALWNRWMFGAFTVGGAYGGRTEAVAEGQESQWTNYLGFLASPDRGLLTWSPLLVIIFILIVRHRRLLPAWALLFLAGGVVYSVAQMRLNHFAGGDTFYGYRHGLELITTIAPAAIFAVGGANRYARLAVAALVGMQFAAISVGATTDAFLLPLDKAWLDNSYLVALRQNPVVLGTWTVLCLATALVLAWWADRARSGSGVGVFGAVDREDEVRDAEPA